MNIAKVITSDIANGLGIRLSIFISGCNNHCDGCFNKDLWNFDYGYEYNDNIGNKILDELSKSQYDGISILGGEPLDINNQYEVSNIIKLVKSKYPNKNIWIFSGYLYEELQPGGKMYISDNITGYILNNIDVLVDGKFDITKKDYRLKFKGSSNQRVIDVKKSIKEGKVVLLNL